MVKIEIWTNDAVPRILGFCVAGCFRAQHTHTHMCRPNLSR